MLGIMGNIDQQVNDKADSMQMQGKTSTVSKDLLDVMATQKIAREKDTALKELQMAQQQNPNTIKDQLEQKVMGMTQNEMTNQTAGIMAQRQQQKQQQRPQQRPPQPGGIAGAMGGAPKPPMPMGGAPKPPMGGMPQGGIAGAAPRIPMMASGGVVGYNKGSVVISDAELKKLGLSRQEFDNLPVLTKQRLASGKRGDEDAFGFSPSRAQEQRDARNAQIKQELKALAGLPAKFGQLIQDEGKRDDIETAKRYGVTAADLGQHDTSGIASAMNMLQQPKKDEPFLPTPTGKAPPPQTATPVPQTGTPVSTTGDGAPPAGDSVLRGVGKLDPSSVTDAGRAALEENKNNISGRIGEGLMSKVREDAAIDPQAGMDAETGRLKDLYGLEELKAMQTGEQAAIKAAQDRYDSPQARRERNIANFIRGGARGRAQGKVNEQKVELKRLREKQENRRKNNQELFQRLEKVDSGSRQMFQDMMTRQQAAFASVESIANNDETAMQNMAQLEANMEGKVQDIVLKAMGVATQAEFNQLLMSAQETNKLIGYYSQYVESLKQLEAEQLTQIMPQAQDVMMRAAKGDATDDEIMALQMAQNLVKGQVYSHIEGLNYLFAKHYERLNPGQSGVANLTLLSGMPGGMSSGQGLQGLQPSGMGQFGSRQLSSPALSSQSITNLYNQYSQPAVK